MANSSLALPGITTLGIVRVDTAGQPISLVAAFPLLALAGECVATITFCTHQSNAAGDLIYIGDSSMTTGPNTAFMSLLGPNVVYKLENQGGQNTVPLGNIKIDASVSGARVRVSVLVG
jgi:hypothetical protein